MSLLYNSNDLQTSSIITNTIDHHGGGDLTLNLLSVANRSRSKLTGKNRAPKTITLKGTLIANTPALMDDLEDTFKGYLDDEDKYLDIPHSTGTRRYIATPKTPSIDRPGGLNWGTFSVDIICAIPFGMDISSTALASGSGVTTATANWSITAGGSAKWQYPIITVTLASGTQLTSQTMQIGNNSNGMVCSINRTWSAGDVLVIDPLADEPVTVNSTPVAFTGSIPFFQKGAGAVTYADTFLTRSVSYSINQYRYWI